MNKKLIKAANLFRTLTLFLAVILAGTFFNCDNLQSSGDTALTINLSSNAGKISSGRSAVPWPPTSEMRTAIFYEITLTGNGAPIRLTAQGGTTVTAAVAAGRWNVYIMAFYPDRNTLYATGSSDVDVIAGRNNVVTVQMQPIQDNPVPTYTATVINGTGGGTYVQGATVTVVAKSLGLPFAGWTATPDVIFDNANSTETTFTMPACNVTITANFDAMSFTVYDEPTWNAAKADITTAGDYLINITGSFGITGSSANTFGGASGINIAIVGSHEISLNNDSMLLVIPAGQTITLQDTKLKGRLSNTNSLVDVNGGTLNMNGSSSVSGNAEGDGAGGGIYVISGGKLIMNDSSSVSGNVAKNNSGGVHVSGNGSSLTMNGSSSISGNTAGTWGGGVTVTGTGATVTMNDNSSISGNISGENGGGLNIASSAAFRVTGGTISGNTATGSGAAIYVNSSTATYGPTGTESDFRDVAGVATGNYGINNTIRVVNGVLQ